MPDKRNIIKMSSPGGKEYNLIFRTYKDAGAFYEWLADYFTRPENRNKTVSIGGYRLKFRDGDLKSEMVSRIQYHSMLQVNVNYFNYINQIELLL